MAYYSTLCHQSRKKEIFIRGCCKVLFFPTPPKRKESGAPRHAPPRGGRPLEPRLFRSCNCPVLYLPQDTGRASTRHQTAIAPAAKSGAAQASSVEPVVHTSSIIFNTIYVVTELGVVGKPNSCGSYWSGSVCFACFLSPAPAYRFLLDSKTETRYYPASL